MNEALARMEITDLELIDQVLAGDQSVFSEIVRRYESKVAATVHGMLGICQEADDIGQEVFVRFYNSLEKFRGEAALGTYLTRIAINLSLNELKKRKRRSIFSFETWSQYHLDVKSDSDEGKKLERKEIVQWAMQKLDTKFRSVIVLRLVEGYSTEETAKILELPLGTVLSRLARGQKKLKEIITPLMEGV